MSDFLWSRQALLAGFSAIDTLVLVIAMLVLGAGALAAWRAWTASPLPIRWWEAIPERLERAEGSYGATALKEAYPEALRRGVTSAGAVHIVLAILAAVALSVAPRPEAKREFRLKRIPIGPESRTVVEHQGKSRERPALKLPDPRRVIPTPIESHVALADMDDLLDSLFTDRDGSLFGDGPGGDDAGDDGPAGSRAGAPNAFGVDPGPGDPVPVDQLPELIWMAEPKYPEMARLGGLEGVVELRLLVDTEGRVRKSRVDRSIAGLDDAALAAAATARFKPALWQGRPVKVWVALPIRFSLH